MATIKDKLGNIPDPAELYESAITLSLLSVLSGTKHPRFVLNINADGSRCLRMDDGAGNNLSVLFSKAGVFMKGFDHESPMSPFSKPFKICAGIYHGFPEALRAYLENPESIGEDDGYDKFPGAYEKNGKEVKLTPVTFSAWWDSSAKKWQCGDVEFPEFKRLQSDGASFLIGRINSDSLEEDYDFSDELLAAVEKREPLTEALTGDLEKKPDPAKLAGYLETIGYGKACPFAF
jgi:hypothetical protein